jgi:class 3 adenylate cyclase
MVPFYSEWTFHVLAGVIAASAGGLGHRAWIRRHWSRPPAGVIREAVLALDLVESTQFTVRYGDRFAMRACNFLEEQALAAAQSNGMTSMESTGDGCKITFPSALAATETALAVLRALRRPPPELASGPRLELRAGISCGVILLDGSGHRHGATINRAFRLMAVPDGAFLSVEGEPRLQPIPDRDRIFLDEDSVEESRAAALALRAVGVCRLKGFTGFHRVFQLMGPEVPGN